MLGHHYFQRGRFLLARVFLLAPNGDGALMVNSFNGHSFPFNWSCELTDNTRMKTTQVEMTLVESDGRQWLIGPKGAILAELEGDISPCGEDAAMAVVSALLANELKISQMRREKAIAERWEAALRLQAQKVSGLAHSPKTKEEDKDRWKKRLSNCAKAITMRVKYGRTPPKPRRAGRTWRQFFEQCTNMINSGGWHGRDEWSVYAAGVARNIRGRFWNQDTKTISTPPNRRHGEVEDCPKNDRRSGIQMLFDGHEID